MDEKYITNAEKLYDRKLRLHNDFCFVIQDLLCKMLNNKKLNYHNISGRVKEKDSFIEKCKKDKYNHYREITDLVGIRLITYLLSDVNEICALIQSEFEVDVENSINKADLLEYNEFGYLSVHYILRLKENRFSLPEYSIFRGMYFELQIRTLLQHAWAEISHDKDYKFKGVLPDRIRRRFFLAAGQLEAIDNEFQSISDGLDKHINEDALKIEKGDLNIEINTPSLIQFLTFKFNVPIIYKSFDGKDSEIVNELKEFGITSLQDLDNIIPKDILEKINGTKDYSTNLTGLLRQIMIICDSIKYFEKCWGGVWPGTSGSKGRLYKAYDIDVDALKQKYLFDDKEMSE